MSKQSIPNDSFIIDKELMIHPDRSGRVIGNIKFFKRGRCAINTKMIGLYFTLSIIISSYGIVIYLIDKYVQVLYLRLLFLISITFITSLTLFQTLFVSFSNPGFLKPGHENIRKDNQLQTLIATIKEQNIFLKFCQTCNIVRDLRVFHCRRCDLCVMRHDHHCPWLSICIGIQNHKYFLVLLIVSMIDLLMYLLLIYFFFFFFDAFGSPMAIDTVDFILLIIILGIDALLIIFISILIGFQTVFISTNQTTSENIRRYKLPNNPYNNGFASNVKEFFCNVRGYREKINYGEASKKYLQYSELLTVYIDKVDMLFPDRRNKNSRVSSRDIEEVDTRKPSSKDANLSVMSAISQKKHLVEEVSE